MTTNIDRFLTPESMITPGVAGSMAMMIGNTIHYQFGVPNGWSILVLSFLIGLLVLAKSGSMITRGVLYVVNSLVIFCMAAGVIALSADTGNQQRAESISLIQSAYAQQSTAELQTEYKNLSAKYDALWAQLKAARPGVDTTKLLQEIEAIERQRAAVLQSIAANTKGKTATTTGGERKFFAPLSFK